MTRQFPPPIPEVPVARVDFAADYYEHSLGFRKDWGEARGGIAQVSRGHCRLFLTDHAFRTEHGNTAPVVIWLNLATRGEVDAVYEAWKGAGARLFAPPVSQPWHVYEFTAADVDGNVLRVFYDFAWELGGRAST